MCSSRQVALSLALSKCFFSSFDDIEKVKEGWGFEMRVLCCLGRDFAFSFFFLILFHFVFCLFVTRVRDVEVLGCVMGCGLDIFWLGGWVREGWCEYFFFCSGRWRQMCDRWVYEYC